MSATQQRSKLTLTVEDHTLQYVRYWNDDHTDSWMEVTVVDSPYLQEATIHSYGDQWGLKFNDPEGSTPYEVASFEQTDNGDLHLYHLQVPVPSRGRGLGAVAVATYYAMCRLYEYETFSMKFGGADLGSLDFLQSLGFSEDYIDAVKDTDYGGRSAVVGEVRPQTVPGGSDSWALHAIPVSEFSTSYFEVEDEHIAPRVRD